ncbi:MAG: DUF58 domain-containing protein, partial [Leeuwenhoekiella sp.]
MKVINLIQNLYLSKRVFFMLALVSTLFLFSYWFNVLYPIGWLVLLLLCVALLVDGIALFRKKSAVHADRLLPEKFSNSDFNAVPVSVTNKYPFKIFINVIDEIPVQFQKRDFSMTLTIDANATEKFDYKLRPLERGTYIFGNLNLYVHTKWNLAVRRYTFKKDQEVKVYPSFVQMKKYAFLAIDNKLSQFGLKKIRRIGHTMEFEQIKEYVTGDDVRTINWKATAKAGNLMVNQYQDEKAQPIYSLIDASRVMKMPFNGLTLLDYAINSALAFSNVALKKGDKTGLITFSKSIENHLAASNKKTHINTILELLYNINTQFLDSDYGRLYA